MDQNQDGVREAAGLGAVPALWARLSGLRLLIVARRSYSGAPAAGTSIAAWDGMTSGFFGSAGGSMPSR
jgi:hypothetical protein